MKYEEIKKIVESELSCSAHNMDHVMRVYNLCLFLAKHEENVEIDVLAPAALLHDIARVKEDSDKSGQTDHAVLGAEMAGEILRKLGYDVEKIEKIKHCISAHRFRTGNEPKSIEAKILFDADKVDVLGAIGITRSFMIAGQYGQMIYNNISIEEYKRDNVIENGRVRDISKHAPNIEYEMKFKKVIDRLYTEKAVEIAKNRMEYMEGFFSRLKNEIDGKM
jgi:uncharacterized protein